MQVIHIPHSLKVTTANEQVHLHVSFSLCVTDGRVDHVQVTVAAAIDGNLHS
jgi:hypothetical protein